MLGARAGTVRAMPAALAPASRPPDRGPGQAPGLRRCGWRRPARRRAAAGSQWRVRAVTPGTVAPGTGASRMSAAELSARDGESRRARQPPGWCCSRSSRRCCCWRSRSGSRASAARRRRRRRGSMPSSRGRARPRRAGPGAPRRGSASSRRGCATWRPRAAGSRPRTSGCRASYARTRTTPARSSTAQIAFIDELKRANEAGAGTSATGSVPADPSGPGDPFTGGRADRPASGANPGASARQAAPLIERFELDGAPFREPDGADTKPLSTWLPAGSHAEAVVLSGVDASAGISSQGDPRPVLLRLTGPAWTAAPSASEDAAALSVDLAGCTVTGAAHGDLSSEKVYARAEDADLRRSRARHGGRDAGRGVRRQRRQGRGARPGGEPRGGAGREGVPRRPRLRGRPGRLGGLSRPRRWRAAAPRRSPQPGLPISGAQGSGPGLRAPGRRSPTT